jgi:serine/threonine protein kinase
MVSDDGKHVGRGKVSSKEVVQLHDKLQNKNIIKYLDYGNFRYNNEDVFVIVYPELSDASGRQLLTRQAIQHVAKAMLESIRDIHNAGYVYNDLKLINFVLSEKRSFMVISDE